jgi:hypothetical protein
MGLPLVGLAVLYRYTNVGVCFEKEPPSISACAVVFNWHQYPCNPESQDVLHIEHPIRQWPRGTVDWQNRNQTRDIVGQIRPDRRL